MPEYKDMKPGQNYLIQVKQGTSIQSFRNGFHGTFKRVEDGNIILDNATQLNVSRLAFGIDRGKSLEGEVRIPIDRVKSISSPIPRRE